MSLNRDIKFKYLESVFTSFDKVLYSSNIFSKFFFICDNLELSMENETSQEVDFKF